MIDLQKKRFNEEDKVNFEIYDVTVSLIKTHKKDIYYVKPSGLQLDFNFKLLIQR